MKKRLNLMIALMTLFASLTQATPDTDEILQPPALKTGDTVALVASAWRTPDVTEIEDTAARLKALGLKIKYGPSLFKQDAYFAGTDEERAEDLNVMFKDPKVKAILELRGGWGTNRILDYLDYEAIKQHSKILMGFSDITSLLLAVHAKTGLVTFHGPVGAWPWPAFTVNYLKRVLFSGEKVHFQNPVKPLNLETDIIQTENRIPYHSGRQGPGPTVWRQPRPAYCNVGISVPSILERRDPVC